VERADRVQALERLRVLRIDRRTGHRLQPAQLWNATPSRRNVRNAKWCGM
jgi:hypothetical protein